MEILKQLKKFKIQSLINGLTLTWAICSIWFSVYRYFAQKGTEVFFYLTFSNYELIFRFLISMSLILLLIVKYRSSFRSKSINAKIVRYLPLALICFFLIGTTNFNYTLEKIFYNIDFVIIGLINLAWILKRNHET